MIVARVQDGGCMHCGKPWQRGPRAHRLIPGCKQLPGVRRSPDVTCTSVLLVRPSGGSAQAAPSSLHCWNASVPLLPLPSKQPPSLEQ